MKHNPKCPVCGGEMKEDRQDETENAGSGKRYSRTVFTCEKDDVWVTLEIPKT
jgi:hypothetical protein